MNSGKTVAPPRKLGLKAVRNLNVFMAKAPLKLARGLNLDQPRPPLNENEPLPTEPAWELAERLADDALPKAKQELVRLGIRDFRTRREVNANRDPQPLNLDGERTSEGLGLGVPLLDALVPTTMHEFAFFVCSLATPGLNPYHEPHARRLSGFLLKEHALWVLAAAGGARTKQMPYAIRYRAMQWLWTPDTRAFAICLRCGTPITRRRRAPKPPRCQHCADEKLNRRKWPENAVAPAGRGTWWLPCTHPNCLSVIEGHRQRKHCATHTSNRIHSGNRPPR